VLERYDETLASGTTSPQRTVSGFTEGPDGSFTGFVNVRYETSGGPLNCQYRFTSKASLTKALEFWHNEGTGYSLTEED
jgi:hypothetical protein